MDPDTRIDDPDDEVIPASPRRRRIATAIGCLFVLVLLAVLIWFGASNLATFERTGAFGS